MDWVLWEQDNHEVVRQLPSINHLPLADLLLPLSSGWRKEMRPERWL